MAACPGCDGKGTDKHCPWYTCLQCGGSGKVDKEGFALPWGEEEEDIS